MVPVNPSEKTGAATCEPLGAASARSRDYVARPQSPERRTQAAQQQIVRHWIDCFNARDLKCMLACMSPDVSFQPLRLHGIERTYQGHDGTARWHERLGRLDLVYQIQVDSLTMPAERTILASGSIRFRDMDRIAPFWGVHTIDGAVIIAARHYLSDTDLAERFALP